MVAGDLREALQRHFGFDRFRESQEPIIQAVLEGRSTLGILPTSGGKSLCYQLPAVLLPGVTVVISPLIALMKDQVDALERRGISAVALTSQMDAATQREALAAIRRGEIRLIYLAPERLLTPEFQDTISRVSVSLLAVDEAHCLSQWGHDFRPDYRLVPLFHRRIGAPPVVALTATAPPAVRQDIRRELGIEHVVLAPFDRPNLRYGVAVVGTEREQRRQVASWLHRLDRGSVILYASTRRATEEWSEVLRTATGESVAAYHAGLPPETRQRIQDAFMSGEVRVIVATSAFGMGVDKPDIRGVLHLGLPDSVEAYVQEVGRAGRDGEPAWGAVITLLNRDALLKRRLLERQQPDPAWIRRRLGEAARTATGHRIDLAVEDEAGDQALQLLPHLLERGIVAEPPTRDAIRALQVRRQPTDGEARDIVGAMQRRYAAKLARFRALQSYLSAPTCRRDFLANYFGAPRAEEKPEVCCDRCHSPAFVAEPRSPGGPAPGPVAGMAADRPLGTPARPPLGPPSPDGMVAAAVDCTLVVTGRLPRQGDRRVRLLLWKGDGSLAVHDAREAAPAFLLHRVRSHAATPEEFTATDGEERLTLHIFRWLWLHPVGDGQDQAAEVPGPMPRARSRRSDPPAAPLLSPDDGVAQRVAEALRQWRRETAQRLRLPPYVILHDRTLVGIAARKVRSLEELGQVPGIGPAKLERYGEEIMEVVGKTVEQGEAFGS